MGINRIADGYGRRPEAPALRRLGASAVLVALLLARSLPAEGEQPEAPGKPPVPSTDEWGDPIPLGALARLGTVRFRSHYSVQEILLVDSDRFLLTRSRELTLSLFEMPSGRRTSVCTPRLPGIRAVTGGRETAALAAIITDGRIAAWDVPALKRVLTVTPEGWTPTALCYGPDESELVVGDSAGQIHLLDAASGRELSTMRVFPVAVEHVACLPASKHVAALADDGKVAACDPHDSQSVVTFPGLSEGRRMVTASASARILVWSPSALEVYDPETTKSVAQARFGSGGLECAALSPDGRRIAAGFADGWVRLLDGKGGIEREIAAHSGAVTGVAFTLDGRRLVTSADELAARLWDPANGAEVDPREGHRAAVTSLAFSSDGARLATGGGDGSVRLWDGRTFAFQRVCGMAADPVRVVAWASDGKQVAAAAGAGIALIDPESGKSIARLTGGVGVIRAMAFLPTDGRLVAGGTDTQVRLWDTGERKLLRVLGTHEGGVWGVATTPDGRHVVTCGPEDPPRAWELKDGALAMVFASGREGARAVGVSPDGKIVATGGEDRRIRIWDWASGKQVAASHTLAGPVVALAFSPDGKRIAVCTTRNSVRLIEVATGRETAAYYWVGDGANVVAWTPDGTRVLSGLWDGTVVVWPGQE